MEKLVLMENRSNYAVISDNLRKVYPGQDGNPDKLAVKGLSLTLAQGECFGMLGPNGAGKTSFIDMVCANLFQCGNIKYYFSYNGRCVLNPEPMLGLIFCFRRHVLHF